MARRVKGTKIPQQGDFTGDMERLDCAFVGTTGDEGLDQRLMDLAMDAAGEDAGCLLAEMLTTAVKMSRGDVSESDFKLANRSLKEMQEAAEVFYPYRDCRKVAIFGSARTKPEEPEYVRTVEFARRMRDEGFMTITGAGPGIMAAGNEGAGRDDSFGLNITLPFETSANEFIAGDEKLIDFNYFFTRKLFFVKEADAAVGLPGGVGTMDEVFEALTLIQTGKAVIYPIVCLDVKGGTYWKFWEQFVREHLFRQKLISETDFALFKVTDDMEEAIAEITGFYANFHSYRYVGDRLVIRIQYALTQEALRELNEEFGEIVKAGEIQQGGALVEEANEPELASLTRIVFRHRRRDFGRLRQLIDAVNVAQRVEG